MKTLLSILGMATMAVLLSFGSSLHAQSAGAIKKELKLRESSIEKTDADARVELADWARGKGLVKDATRLLKAALKIDPDHAGANTAMGLVKFDGEWVTRAKAEVLQQKAHDASMKAKGMQKVDGVWVDKGKVSDAKKGVFWHDGEQVSKTDKISLSRGMVRHPRTGKFIEAKDLEQAEAGKFPTKPGLWADEKEADAYHSDINTPWVLRTEYAVLVGTLPLSELETFKIAVDSAIESVLPIFLGKHPPASHRPIIIAAKDTEEYKVYGSNAGDGGSAYGAFLATDPVAVPGYGTRFPTVFNNLEGWGEYYVKHAAALGVVAGHCNAHEIEAPRWLLRGVGSIAERFQVAANTAHFGRQHVQKGGVKNVKTFFSAFDINGSMDSKVIDYNIFQAGLLLDYAMKSGDEDALEAMQAVSAALTETPKKAKKAIDKLKKVLIKQEDGIRTRLEQLTR